MARYFVCINLLLYYFLSCQIWTLFWESLAFVLAIHCVDLLFSMSRYIFAPKTWCMVSMVCIMSLFGRDTRTCIGYGWRGCWWKGQKMNTVLTWNVFFCRELGQSWWGRHSMWGGGTMYGLASAKFVENRNRFKSRISLFTPSGLVVGWFYVSKIIWGSRSKDSIRRSIPL